MNYLPSLNERRLKIIENCCGSGGGDGFSMDTDPGYGDESPVPTALDTALDKLKKRKKKKVQEESPPGFEGTVKAMKKHDDIDNPYALSWWMKNKGYKSHKKKDGSDK